ncbi:hypothetical protein N8773_00865 [Candidatus Pseudothioglobus singularis]|nr:hypothetical protein [Candidatus Pseudothioglobus singularis]
MNTAGRTCQPIKAEDMLLQLKTSFLSIFSMNKTHSLMSYMLVFSHVLQGFLLDNKIFGVPVWFLMSLLFLPFVYHYSKLLLNLRNVSLKIVYSYLFLLTILLSVLNLYSSSFKKAATVWVGMLVATVIFYEYRNRINVFIKLIIVVILVQSVFSIMQFHFDFEFFEGFTRRTGDRGSSGTFGFPVPYGYFMLTFFPIVYPFILSFFKKTRPLNNIFIVFLSLLGCYGLLLSFQRGVIILTVASIIVINMFILKRSLNLIILLLMALLVFVFFQLYDPAKDLLSWDIIATRVINQYTWITQNDSSNSPHVYIYNLFLYYGFIGLFLILVFYTILLGVILKHHKYSSKNLPNGALIGSIMSIVSYHANALFHNNGHFAYDVVGFISIGYVFALIYFISEKHHHSSYHSEGNSAL